MQWIKLSLVFFHDFLHLHEAGPILIKCNLEMAATEWSGSAARFANRYENLSFPIAGISGYFSTRMVYGSIFKFYAQI